jgi:hypothetical protein
MNITTSFGQVNFLSNNIVELIIDKGVEVSLELIDEYDALMAKNFTSDYAILVNRLNSYSFSYEALLCIGSAQYLKAVAIITYSSENKEQTKNLQAIRHMDDLNIREFSGLELGRESAIKWLEKQLSKTVS